MIGRLGIDDVRPSLDGGRLASKAVVGEHVPIRAVVWREGHDAVAATVVWRGPEDETHRLTRMAVLDEHADSWVATIVPDHPGMWTFRVDAWSDPWATWRHAVEVKVAAAQSADELRNDLRTGAALLTEVAGRPERAAERALLSTAAERLLDEDSPLPARIAEALSGPVHAIMTEHPVRELVTKGRKQRIHVDRERALFGAWYEFFPRSNGPVDADGTVRHGTFKTATQQLERAAAMGFDVAYLPPIHPIGEVNRKGRNNSVVCEEGDVGSPWAIGSKDGGHDAIHPLLGTIEDFDAFVARANELGLEVALDLALQCAPDHPWVTEHPEWFTTRPDGTIAYAENPPKRYQDIYPLNFDNDPKGLYNEVLRVVRHWIDHGVRIFRVDNPHTKPPDFWHWLICEIKETDPDVLFLAEAFTRPAKLYGLARLGFTQSYTYFTWRTFKQELIEFGVEQVEHADEARPNLFVNTPDILHASLQHGGPAMFAIRATLAATMAPTWGVYSGFELFEHQAVFEGSEEYLDSEKYQLRHRDYAGALLDQRSLEPWLTRLNEIRKNHPALRWIRNLHFHHVDNDALLAYSKKDEATGDIVLVVVTLDSYHAQQGTLWLDLEALGFGWGAQLTAQDLVSGQTWRWGQANFVRLDPTAAVAHIVTLTEGTPG
ncbi:alpha-1,4-glucan--maltose-1-phosphate maltosyltransferase [Labedaea rhizosphaerae]|uniref:Alpha-1,4-glucan:maltose-1-phosphate maltosyltransferase n=1 Tax=Labedaea rhizosphaerae TaxID=598644 RepID=A0A4R6SBZ5_LABRH|nr:alpha-1,4-glucan--maltose-1-phosphate maltosyltransferase [Labedaea rhizosphaerae]TDP97579.1 alpha-1,4-glucan:maltose-1-phosphate maltosyltransferase [Labedaea rhizosphaerae]